MLESKMIELGDDSFQITQFTATKGVKFFRMMTKYAGPLVGLMGAKSGDGDAVSSAINSLMDNLGDDKFDNLIKDMITSSGFVKSDGTTVQFDYFFAGAYHHLIKLITEVVKFNYGTVFQEGALEDLGAQMQLQG